jgi:uncharacterized membrane protein YfcA
MDKLKEFINKLNSSGIPLPLIRLDGKPTFTGTLAFISFNTALLGQIGKVTKVVGDVDLSAASYLFLMCLGAYLGRRIPGLSDSKTEEGEVVSEKAE